MRFPIEPLESRIAPATFVVTNFSDNAIAGSLRQHILDANASAGPDIIEFRASGTIRLTADLPDITDDLEIVVARGKTVKLDGRGLHQILEITGEDTDVTLDNLDFIHGRAEAGGALAIATTGVVVVKNSAFIGNRAVGQGSAAQGGAIDIAAGQVTIQDSLFSGNVADGRSPDPGSFDDVSAFGGAISNAGNLTLIKTILTRNLAIGVEGSGGAIFNAESSNILLSASTLTANTAQGLHGANGAAGARGAKGANATEPGQDGDPGEDGEAGEAGTNAGSARGGAIFNAGTIGIMVSTLANNVAKGGDGGDGGAGGAGGAGGRGRPFEGEGFAGPGGSGGQGGDAGAGGGAEGGAIYNAGSGVMSLEPAILLGNSARAGVHGVAGRGGAAAPGGVAGEHGASVPSDVAPLNANGGGVFNNGELNLRGAVLTKNSVIGENARGGGIANDSSGYLSTLASVLSKNTAIARNGANGLAGTHGANGAAGEPGGDGESGEEGAAGTDGEKGGDALGGGIFNLGMAFLDTTTVSGNSVDAGNGGNGGNGGKGGNGGARGKAERDPETGDVFPAGLPGAGANGGAGGGAGDSGAAAGGGIYSQKGDWSGGILSLRDSTISGNVTKAGVVGRIGLGGAAGAGDPDQPATRGEHGHAGSPGEAGGGGIFSASGSLTVVQSTIAGNVAAGEGGGLKVETLDGQFRMRNSTVALNTARIAGGLQASDAEIISTIIAKNAVTNKLRENRDVGGALDAEFSLIGSLGDAVLTGANNLFDLDPKLGVLRNNGGATATMLPAAGSPVLDAGANPEGLTEAALTEDQRDATRVVGLAADIGAVEVQPPRVRSSGSAFATSS